MMAPTLLSFVVLIAGFQQTYGTSINTDNIYSFEGSNDVEITCSYCLDYGESLDYLYIETNTTEIAVFFPINGTTFYSKEGRRLQNRSTLVIRKGSVGLKFNVTECSDARKYECNLQTNFTTYHKRMQLNISGSTSKPKLLVTKSERLDNNETLELECTGLFATLFGGFVWYGYPPDGQTVNLTERADPGVPYRVNCSYERTSHLKLNLTRQDQGLVIRCASSDVARGIVPSSEDTCDEHCAKSLPFHFTKKSRSLNPAPNVISGVSEISSNAVWLLVPILINSF